MHIIDEMQKLFYYFNICVYFMDMYEFSDIYDRHTCL